MLHNQPLNNAVHLAAPRLLFQLVLAFVERLLKLFQVPHEINAFTLIHANWLADPYVTFCIWYTHV
jgi:hypothetical protein